jgi:hypothetical protein
MDGFLEALCHVCTLCTLPGIYMTYALWHVSCVHTTKYVGVRFRIDGIVTMKQRYIVPFLYSSSFFLSPRVASPGRLGRNPSRHPRRPRRPSSSSPCPPPPPLLLLALPAAAGTRRRAKPPWRLAAAGCCSREHPGGACATAWCGAVPRRLSGLRSSLASPGDQRWVIAVVLQL